MILYPLSKSSNDASPHGGMARGRAGRAIATAVGAWEAVERKQKENTSEWWLVAQPDHAALAGDLAANISCAYFPQLDAKVVEAITLHDAGWAQFDGGTGRGNGGRFAGTMCPMVSERGRPLSFLEVGPREFLRAWNNSIRRAEESSAIGGILVSQHFCRLAQSRLRSVEDDAQDAKNLGNFVAMEAERQRQLQARIEYSEKEICVLVDVLQFCDLLSLYLCCGSQEDVEFPQKFQGRSILLHRDSEMCRMEPAVFGAGVSLGVSARHYPEREEPGSTTLAFLLA